MDAMNFERGHHAQCQDKGKGEQRKYITGAVIERGVTLAGSAT
jgi:hypothetical protein